MSNPAENVSFKTLGNKALSDDRFPDPFCDVASLAMPENIQSALLWCEYIMNSSGVYRQAVERVVSYFITDIEIKDTKENEVGREEKDKYQTFLEDTLGIKNALKIIGLDFMCLHGDTRVPTADGVFPIRELVGKTVNVIARDGEYRPATFKRYGEDELWEVTFSDDRSVLATATHRWYVKNNSGKHVEVTTEELYRGHRVRRTVAPRPEKNDDWREGVRHGFVYGDGSLYNRYAENKQTKSVANFYGPKDDEMLQYFDSCLAPIPVNLADSYSDHVTLQKIHGLPARFKQLPENWRSASYWYGFVCGFLAADGSVDTYGCTVLTQSCRKTMEAIEAQLPRIGMVAGPIRDQLQETILPGSQQPHTVRMYYMTLLKQFMCVDDILLAEHRNKFLVNKADSNYGEYVGIKSVTPTGIIAPVYCCEEPVTRAFVVDNGIITGNCYGNSFTSLIVPFRRYLSCRRCGFELPLTKAYNNPKCAFKWQNFEFHATCPQCKYRGAFKHIDRRSEESNGIKLKRWSPHEIDLVWDPFTDEIAYIWKIPEEYRRLIREGHLHQLKNASWEVIQAIKTGQNLLFDDDVIYHLKEDALAGMRNRGWGISRILVNFRQAWYVQILQRYNEAIALDYIIPFRVVTPMPRGGDAQSSDPVHTINLSDFSSRVNHMIKQRAKDPARWNVLPFPVQYTALGGDASQLAPKELIDQGMDTLLTCIGIPVELYKGTLTLQAAPAALRLFEAHWNHLPHNLNRFLSKLGAMIARVMSWEPVNIRLMRTTHADDLNRQMAKLQLMMGKEISKTTGLKSVGLDYDEEVRRQLEEEKIYADEQKRMQKEMEQAQQMEDLAMEAEMLQQQGQPGASATGMPPGQPGAPPPQPGAGGMLPQPGMGGGSPVDAFIAQRVNTPNVPRAPEELQAQAQQLAQQILSMPESQKDSELIKLKKKDQLMHSLVSSVIEDIRQQAKNQGGAAVMQQQFGQPGGPQ